MPSLANRLIQGACRLYPFPNGMGHIVYKYFRNRPFDEKTLEVNTIYGFPMTVFPEDLIGRVVYFAGHFESSIVRVICANCTGGETILDIGANIGTVSCALLSKIPDSQVIAVEPNEKVFGLLESNMNRISSERAKCLKVGISDENRHARLAVNAINSGANYVVDGTAKPDCTAIDIELVTGETLLERYNIQSLDIVKIDVEGHEEQVLKSIEILIERFRPRLVLFECFESLADTEHPVRQLFDRQRYDISAMQKKLTGERICSLADAERYKRPVDTYLARPQVVSQHQN